MLEPQDPAEVPRRLRDLLLLTILTIAALLFSADLKPSIAEIFKVLGIDPLLFSGRHTTTAFPKATSFYVLVWLALILEFVLVYREGWRDLRSWWPMLACLGAFLLWCAISAVWISPMPRSFRDLSRWLALISLIVVSIGAGQSAWFRRQFLWFGTFVPLIVALYACAQSLGLDLFLWPEFTWEREFPRVTSTLGNPDFLAGYLLGTIPISAAYGFANANRWQKALSGISVLVQLMAIVVTLSRGVWIGLFFSAAALLIIMPNRGQNIRRLFTLWKRPEIAGACLVALIVGALILWPALSSLYVRVAGGIDVSLGGRLHIYTSCLRLVAKHPLIGVGLDAFPVRFPEVRTPELSQYLPFKQWYVEHVHCEPLEVLVDVGIIGFLFWAGILFFWGRAILRHVHQLDKRRALLVSAAWVAVIGILGHNLFTVTLRHSSTYVPFWAFLGIAAGASSRPNGTLTNRTWSEWCWIILALILVGAPMTWVHATREHQADRYFHEAGEIIKVAVEEERRDSKVKSCHLVLDLLARADRLVPAHKESLYWRAWAYYELADYQSSRAEYERTIELEGPFVDSVPNMGKVLLGLATDYMAAGLRDHGLQAYRESVQWWEWACRMEPRRAGHWRCLASALGMLGRVDEAREAFDRAVDLEANPAEKERIRNLIQQLERDADALEQQARSFTDMDTEKSSLHNVDQ